jgi:serine protease
MIAIPVAMPGRSGNHFINVDTGATTPSVSSYSNGSNYSVGTSFAAPLVAATVSLMQAIKPDATPAQIIAALRASARPFPSSGAGAGAAGRAGARAAGGATICSAASSSSRRAVSQSV